MRNEHEDNANIYTELIEDYSICIMLANILFCFIIVFLAVDGIILLFVSSFINPFKSLAKSKSSV